MALKTLLAQLKFDSNGLIPAIVQDAQDDAVLMTAYMNREALTRTLSTGEVHFWSRSRKSLWRKGETSGNHLRMKEIRLDCDGDALLIRAEAAGPACHTGARSCFYRTAKNGAFKRAAKADPRASILDRVYDVILDRKRSPKAASYVSGLLKSGPDAILKKIGEESGELIIASKNRRRPEIVWEAADLWFHALVLLGHHGIRPSELYRELEKRFGRPGLAPKRGRS